ncbi:hypothetical protein G6F56_006547 [Rhizopus delemar]|nr:hypothetical protein G6F56_006547 [Rhizopus delemar]
MLPLLVQHHRAHLSKMATGQDIGVLYLLRQVSEVYGVSECNVYDDNILDENKNDSETTTSSSSVRGMSTASKNILFWGWPLLQVDVLKQCISVSEALLDNKSQLYYTAILLKALYQHISKHDQIRLATSIQAMVATKNTNKTVSGTESMINYWGVNIISNIRPKNPIPRREIHAQYVHCKNDKDTGEILEDPFIYNPFALKKAKDDILLVKDELCEFKVTLVNPFGFCLELRNIKLSTSGVDFHSVPTAISIPANATVTVTLAGTPNEKGLLVPLLKIKNTSLLHNAIMLYEGEVTHIIIEIENIGNTPVDFIKLSFTESTTVQYSPFNHNLSSEDQYEFELNAKKVHVFSWEADSSTKNPVDPTDMFYLSPGGTGTVSIKVYGKRDCCGGSIQIDYGYLNRNNHAENQNRIKTAFYTRQLYINILLTVYQNLKPSNWDVVYIRHATRYSTNIEACITEDDLKIHQRGEIKEPGSPVRYLMDAATDMIIGGHSKSYYCFISLDITNTWTTSFDITFSVSNKECENILSNITIQPGCTKRVLLPIKKLFLPLDICLRDIPSVDSNQKFVKSQEPEEQHTKRRQIFWYREELLKRIECFWYCRVTGRKGTINLRPFVKLTENQLAVIKKENVEFSINVHGHSARKIGRRLFECFNNEQITIDVTIRNRLLHPARLILRIQPVQGYANSKQECQFSEDVLIEGMHQVLLKEVPAENGQMTCSFPLYFLSSGRFELLYHAEDLNTRNVYYDHEWIVFNVLEPSVKMKKDPS